MIAACPKCSARYRIEKGKLGPEGARLKCSRCEAVFRVRPPATAANSLIIGTPDVVPAAFSRWSTRLAEQLRRLQVTLRR